MILTKEIEVYMNGNLYNKYKNKYPDIILRKKYYIKIQKINMKIISEQMNENLIKDTTKKPEAESGAGLEISPSPELNNAAKSLGAVQKAIDNDQPISLSQIQQIQEAMKKLTVNIGGEEMTLEDTRFKKNAKIWEEIRQGKYNNIKKLTCITPAISKVLSRHQGNLNLSGLTSLSDQAAEHLSHHQKTLWLRGLTSLSDQAAEHLSHHQGYLGLDRVTSLSDKTAEYLSHHQGGLFISLTSFSDQVAEQLAHYRGNLWLNSLVYLSDQAAEYLSHQQGTLMLLGLTSLSDQAAEYLAKHKEKVSVPEAIQEQIAKFKK